MAGDGDREMVLANFQVNRRFSCILCLFLCQPVLLLILIQSITGIENLDECITLLDHHNWDLMVGSAFSLLSLCIYLHTVHFDWYFHCLKISFPRLVWIQSLQTRRILPYGKSFNTALRERNKWIIIFSIFVYQAEMLWTMTWFSRFKLTFFSSLMI